MNGPASAGSPSIKVRKVLNWGLLGTSSNLYNELHVHWAVGVTNFVVITDKKVLFNIWPAGVIFVLDV